MRILVTGAGGYIGRHLVPRLWDEGHEVFGVTRKHADLAHSPRQEQDEWWTAVDYLANRLFDADTVIHLAGRVAINLLPNPKGAHLPPVPGPCDIGALYRDNVLATANVLDYCLKAGVKHLIFASTQAVYGMPRYMADNSGRWAEKPLEQYATSKLLAEQVLEMGRRQGQMVTIVRLPGVYGGDRREGVIHNMCKGALTDGIVRVKAQYPLPINVMHVADVVDALCGVVDLDLPNEYWPYGIPFSIDVSGPETCSLKHLAEDIASLVPGCRTEMTPGAPRQPEMAFLGHVSTVKRTPKPRKERLTQVLEEIRRDAGNT